MGAAAMKRARAALDGLDRALAEIRTQERFLAGVVCGLGYVETDIDGRAEVDLEGLLGELESTQEGIFRFSSGAVDHATALRTLIEDAERAARDGLGPLERGDAGGEAVRDE